LNIFEKYLIIVIEGGEKNEERNDGTALKISHENEKTAADRYN